MLLCVLDAEGAKTMPLCAVAEEKYEACEGILCLWTFREGERGERRPGREQPEDAV
jgi:hypothetical protein